MRKDRLYTVGDTDKNYELTLIYENNKNRNGGKVTAKVEKSARLEIGGHYDSMGFDPDFWVKVLDFQREADKIVKLARKLMKEGVNVEISYTVSGYEHTAEREVVGMFGKEKTTLNQISFNQWTFSSLKEYENSYDMEQNAKDGENGGFYLSPDVRYTDESKAIWISWRGSFVQNLVEFGSYAEHEYK